MNKPFDFYVLTPVVFTVGGIEYNIELSLFGNFETIDNIPSVPVPSKFIIEKISKLGREVTDKKSIESVNKFASYFFKNNPEKFRKLCLEELSILCVDCMKSGLTRVGIKSKV